MNQSCNFLNYLLGLYATPSDPAQGTALKWRYHLWPSSSYQLEVLEEYDILEQQCMYERVDLDQTRAVRHQPEEQ